VKINVARDLGAAVRGRRIDLGRSQDDLAGRAGVSRRWLSAFEAGKGSVELGMVLRVLAALDLEVHVAPLAGRDRDSTATVPLADDVDLDVFLSGFDEGSP
jgi:HTH-type transcriptional regulator / antitoxin HipB